MTEHHHFLTHRCRIFLMGNSHHGQVFQCVNSHCRKTCLTALGCPLNPLLVSDFHLPSALSLRGRLGLSLLVTHPTCLLLFSISR